MIAFGRVLVGNKAHAFELGTPAEEHPYQSPQNAAFEFRLGPYKPNIDDASELTNHPYDTSFGSGPRVYAGVELDWQVYRIPGIGTIGPALQIGRASMTRKSRDVVGTYALTIYPLCFDAVLRVDQLWRRFGVPFMPYAKAGLGVGFWNASTAFRAVLADGEKSSGRSFGETAAFGAAVPLDFFDTGTSRGTDEALGINTSSVYVEYSLLELNGFGAAHTLRVGDRTWVAGLMFEL
jgi:hypothetical protein